MKELQKSLTMLLFKTVKNLLILRTYEKTRNKLKLSLSVQLGLVLILCVKSRCQIPSLSYTSFWYILDGG